MTTLRKENESADSFLYRSLNLQDWWKDLVVFDKKDKNRIDLFASQESITRTEKRAVTVIHQKFGNCLSYVEATKIWYTWDGMIHVPCEGEAAVRKLINFYVDSLSYALALIEDEVLRQVAEVKANGGDGVEDKVKSIKSIYDFNFKKHRMFREYLHSNSGNNALFASLKVPTAVSRDYFESDHDWFAMHNCVMDLKKFRAGETDGVLVPHNPIQPITKYFNADYDMEAISNGAWDTFISSSLPDEEVRNYVQEVVGAAFMATTKTKVVLNLLGKKDSGKSVFLETFYDLCNGGAGYASMPDPGSIMQVQSQNFDQDQFRGRRFIAISEPDESKPADAAFLKRFSGDGLVHSAGKYANSYGWRPQGILFVASNNPLKVNIHDPATVERIKIIDFPVQFKSAGPGVPAELTKDVNLGQKLGMDGSRILMWVIEGMMAFRDRSFTFNEPVSILQGQEKIVFEGSNTLMWIQDMIDGEYMKIDFTTPIKQCLTPKFAYDAYRQWCTEEQGIKNPTMRKFFMHDIKEKYGETMRSSGKEYISGLVALPAFTMQYNPGNSPYVQKM